MTTIPLVDVGTFKAHYSPGLDPLNDAALEEILIAATDLIYRIAYPRIFLEPSVAYVEYHDGARAAGRMRDSLYTKHYPITSITSVKENGVAIVTASGYTTTADALIYSEAGILMRRPGGTSIPLGVVSGIGSRWTEGYQNIEITYKAGYSAANMPGHITQACIEAAAMMLREPARTGDQAFSRSVSGSASNEHDMPASWREKVSAMAPWGRPRTWAA